MTGDDAGETAGTSVAARDELAGVVDLFGALTRAELREALGELAFKQGTRADDERYDAAVESAIRDYYLVFVDDDATGENAATGDPADLLAVGPAAFPSLPPNAEDLPHILDVGTRQTDRETLGRGVRRRLVADVDTAVERRDDDRLERLLDVCYDLEAWAAVDVEELRERIVDVLEADHDVLEADHDDVPEADDRSVDDRGGRTEE